jgi:hypothetical protein
MPKPNTPANPTATPSPAPENDRKGPVKIGDLRAAEWNPRTINDESARTLSESIREFGDLSGIVVNADGTLISGHQRVKVLTDEHGPDLVISGGFLTLPNGNLIRVREVDWDETRAKAAAIVANNQAAQGKFTLSVFDLIDEIEDAAPDLSDRLSLRLVDVDGDDSQADPNAPATAAKDGPTVPGMELQPYEHYDYVLLLARTTADWYRLCHFLGIVRVNSSPIANGKKIGLGRAIPADKLLKMFEKYGVVAPEHENATKQAALPEVTDVE